MPTWMLNWQSGSLEVTVPDANLVQVVERPTLPQLGSPTELVARALANPIGSPPLRELIKPGSRVGILLTDVHDSIFGADGGVGIFLLDLLNEIGVPDRNIWLIHSAGMHGHHRARQKIGEAILARVAYHEHAPTDESNLTFYGATRAGTPVWINKLAAECDFLLGVGGCNPSLFGIQGGAGIILPGTAGRDTIRHNHSLMMTTVRPLGGWGPGNLQREDIMDAGDLVGFRFKIDFTANTVFAGYFREEWPQAVEYVKKHQLVQCDPCDIYVHAPAGDRELPSAVYMGLEYGSQILRPGGILILVVSARDHTPLPPRPVAETLFETVYITEQWMRATGESDPALQAYWGKRDQICKDELLRLSLEELSRIVARRLGEPRTTTMAWSHRHCLEKYRCFLVSEGISADEGAAMGFAYTTRSFKEALKRAFDELGSNARIIANPPPNNGIPYPKEVR